MNIKLALVLALVVPGMAHAGETRVPATKTPTAGVTAPPRLVADMPAEQGMVRTDSQDSRLSGGTVIIPPSWTGSFDGGSGSGSTPPPTEPTAVKMGQIGVWIAPFGGYVNSPPGDCGVAVWTAAVDLLVLDAPVAGTRYWWAPTDAGMAKFKAVTAAQVSLCDVMWESTPQDYFCTPGVSCPGD